MTDWTMSWMVSMEQRFLAALEMTSETGEMTMGGSKEQRKLHIRSCQ